ncbi:HPr(Ser) kinase/phosphatase [Pediococcus claussenii]|uniref:HPr kinase/phosphorylase n=1 Tax=Pediococcus claussenii (strain ATCC BAA-344 / DSM 14800 / JCM 18046 / KCTC 3811 / LMG 21948 / P06) TaxID=701521 RepID=G8PC14_PEDCP|nr:HPr(Ser) kinase/phosphatase [Pediococcus claussenii]AEV94833.1 HPr(Ser) kinase/phosphatase [Pediococcus claussenii ATCC BAA-344]ANZ70030.1 HPr kinase/phosphorylase [Pediococcus claussenii]ANZ71845.1 HPr kinase/phosphorylase [Pediococcus claussenii]KRN21011.1 hprK protein [Pediococcus claussenii]
MADSVSVSELVKKIRLDVYSGKEFLKERNVTVSDISRPGLELTNYFKFYPHERVQLFGQTEISYAKDMMSTDDRRDIFNRMAMSDTPAFVISRGLPIPAELMEASKNNQVPILGSNLPTSRLLSNMTNYLESHLAERESVHGELMEIYGLGVLITGDSGIGKSETALDLIKRGHRLIADDRVDVYQQDEQTLVGEAPKILQHLLEIRGVGIIDVMNLFGAGAVRGHTDINLIVHLQNWDKETQFDRLGNGETFRKFFDVEIPKITVPVRVGRNLGDIIEAAAMNFRARNMGYDATKVFDDNLNELIRDNSKK